MHIVCCIKQVPDTTQVKIDPVTNTLIRAGVESIVNPYDLVGVEAAVKMAEKYGGKVSVITMGIPAAEAQLRIVCLWVQTRQFCFLTGLWQGRIPWRPAILCPRYQQTG